MIKHNLKRINSLILILLVSSLFLTLTACNITTTDPYIRMISGSYYKTVDKYPAVFKDIDLYQDIQKIISELEISDIQIQQEKRSAYFTRIKNIKISYEEVKIENIRADNYKITLKVDDTDFVLDLNTVIYIKGYKKQ